MIDAELLSIARYSDDRCCSADLRSASFAAHRASDVTVLCNTHHFIYIRLPFLEPATR